jgi:ATP-dependent DNA helicase DinG
MEPALENPEPLEPKVSEHFPYASYRPGQREALDAARKAFAKGKRFVVIEAPTGAGKSGIAVTLARESRSAYILTAQKLLQDQYVRDFPDLSVVKGRSNYPCLVQDTHAGAAPCMAGRKYPICEDCTYLIAKDDAVHAQVATLNYPYFLAETNYQGAFGKRDLLVLDEAHNTEEMLMRFVEVNLSRTTLARAGIHLEFPQTDDLEERIHFATQLIPQITRALVKLEDEIKKLENVPPDLSMHKSELESLVSRLRLLQDDENTWVCEEGGQMELGFEGTRDGGAWWWKFRPVRVAAFVQQYIFKHAHRVLFLSATILDPETFLRALGVPMTDAAFIRVPSSFPARNRPIYPLAVARLNRTTLDAELPKLTEVISKLLDKHDSKGVIHAHSYKVLRYLIDNLPSRHRPRLVYHTGPKDREDALSRHLASPANSRHGGSVLITPSMTEGIDLHGDLARWQVIVKVPYPYLGDPQVAARRALDPAWYEWRTALRLVQAYGRAVRSADDHAVTYVLDALFASWVGRQRDRLPRWFLEAIAPTSGQNPPS